MDWTPNKFPTFKNIILFTINISVKLKPRILLIQKKKAVIVEYDRSIYQSKEVFTFTNKSQSTYQTHQIAPITTNTQLFWD